MLLPDSVIFSIYICGSQRLTVCVTGAGAGVDSAREQENFDARNILENGGDS